MKAPRQPGDPVDMRRVRGWLADFANYRHTITERRVENWLSQFDLPDVDLAARVLDCVDFVTNERITAAYRSGLPQLTGWDPVASRRRGQWRFAGFSSSAGESGDAMLQRFRHANNLSSKRYDQLFVHRSELLAAGLKRGDTIVLVDDFSATGTQVLKAWPLMHEFIPEGPRIVLLLVASTQAALKAISTGTEMEVHTDILLGTAEGVFDETCKRFSDTDKATLKKYCRRVGPQSAAEFSGSGYVIVFAHTCPNNSLPILHSSTKDWEGLFRRYD